jgi:hypothetical protein
MKKEFIPYQEALELAAERSCESITHPYCDREKSMFIKGAKWQAENTCKHNYILTSEKEHRVIKCLKCNNIQAI